MNPRTSRALFALGLGALVFVGCSDAAGPSSQPTGGRGGSTVASGSGEGTNQEVGHGGSGGTGVGTGGGSEAAGTGGTGGVGGSAASAGIGSTGGSGGSAGAGDSGAEHGGASAPDGAQDAGPRAVLSDPGVQGDGDFQVGPDYPKSGDLTPKSVPMGKTFDFTMDSKNSKFFTGLTSTLLAKNQHTFSRAIKVYVPAKYKDGTAAPIFVIHDGPKQFDIAKIALDNLSNETTPARQLPAFVIISVANGGSDDKGSERGLEYDTMSDLYTRFIEGEVLPAVLSQSAIKSAYPQLAFTSDPEGRATMGCSSGGAAAFTMAWFHPDLYRRVITYSATLVDQQDDDAPEEAAYPLGAWEYHAGLSLISKADPKPLRIFLSTNESDIGASEPESGHHNWVIANKNTAAILKSKGYHYRFLYGKNAGHAPVKLQENTLPEALLWVWRGYPTN